MPARRTLAVLLAAAALIVSGGSAASAAAPPVPPPIIPPSFSLVTATSASNGSAKSVTVSCPARMQVVGAGAEINDTGYGAGGAGDSGDGRVSITDLVPDAGLTSVTATAGIRDPLNWDFGEDTFSLTVQARCARTGVLPVVTGLTRVVSPSTANGTSDYVKYAQAVCPAGTVVYGTGFQLANANGKVFVNRVQTMGIGNQLEVYAYVDLLNQTGQVALGDLFPPAPYTGVWGLKAIAVCAQPRGSDVEVRTEAVGETVTSTDVECPAGTVVTGAGVDLLYTSGQAGYGSVIALEALALDPEHASARASIDESGTWIMSGHAICH